MTRSGWAVCVVLGLALIGCSDEQAEDNGGQATGGGVANPDGGRGGGAGRQVDLTQLPATVRQLVTELRRGEAAQRRAAIEALGELKAQAIPVLPELRGYLEGGDALTRIAAAKAVAQIEQARRDQPLALADVAGEYVTRPEPRAKRSITGIWKTRAGDSVVSPFQRHTPAEGIEAAQGFLRRIEVTINDSGQAQFTMPVPTQFRRDFEGHDTIDMVGRCDVTENGMIIEAYRSLGFTESLSIRAAIQRPEPTDENEGRRDFLLRMKLTFVGDRDLLEAGGWLVMERQ